jgi:hypothetical protein
LASIQVSYVHLVLLARHVVHGERHGGIRHIYDHVDVIDVVPLARNAGADIRLVLVVGADEIDLHAVGGRIEVVDRQFGGRDRARTGIVRIEARHVGEYADLDRNRILRVRCRRHQRRKRESQAYCCFH